MALERVLEAPVLPPVVVLAAAPELPVVLLESVEDMLELDEVVELMFIVMLELLIVMVELPMVEFVEFIPPAPAAIMDEVVMDEDDDIVEDGLAEAPVMAKLLEY